MDVQNDNNVFLLHKKLFLSFFFFLFLSFLVSISFTIEFICQNPVNRDHSRTIYLHIRIRFRWWIDITFGHLQVNFWALTNLFHHLQLLEAETYWLVLTMHLGQQGFVMRVEGNWYQIIYIVVIFCLWVFLQRPMI